MDFGYLRFASTREACDYLYELMGGKILIGKVTPKKDDYVTFFHPVDNKWYVIKHPGGTVDQFHKSDLIGEFPESYSFEKIGQELRVKIFAPLYEARKKITKEMIPDFLIADSVPSDQDLGPGDLSFAVSGGTSSSAAKTRGRYKDRAYFPYPTKFSKEENLKAFKKSPARIRKKEDRSKREVDLSKLYEMGNPEFASMSEAIQFLSDITDSTIKIRG